MSGHPSQEDLREKERFLRAEIEGDSSRAHGGGWLFARYNNQGFPYGPFRRNDLLIPLEVRAVFREPVWGPHRLHAWYANGKNDHGNFVVPFAGTLGNLAQVSMRSTAPCQAMPMTEPQLPLTVAMLCTMQANSVDLWGGVDWAFVDRVVAHKV